MKSKLLTAALLLVFSASAVAAIHLVVPLSLSSLSDSKSSSLMNNQEHLEDNEDEAENGGDEIGWELDPANPINPAIPDREKPARP